MRRFGLLLLIGVGVTSCGKTAPDEKAGASETSPPPIPSSQQGATAEDSSARATTAPATFDKDTRGSGAPPSIPGLPPPSDLRSPPAKTTALGVAQRTLQAGTGEAPPKPADRVYVHITSWTSDGSYIDSSTTRGTPLVLPVSATNSALREALTTMSPGEKRRLWVPANITGSSAIATVLDVELLGVYGRKAIPSKSQR